jgi:hypothetical protein
MPNYICVTCGVQFPESPEPPPACPICEDPRQFIGLDGQKWTTLAEMRAKFRNEFREEEPLLHSIHTGPSFAIGQRAFLVRTPQGNLLWDCLSLLDEATISAVSALGGIAAIAISHPHYYSSMVDWSAAFGNAPIYIHESDAKWVMRPDPRVRFWSGPATPLLDSLTLILTPGHFDGFQVLHWRDGAGGRGALLSGDQPQVCMDTRWLSFMYSYPNYIPLPPAVVSRIVEILRPYAFDRIYGAFPKRTVASDGNAALERSADRYRQAVGA